VFGLLTVGLLALYHCPYPDGSPPRRLTGAYLRACARSAGTLLALVDPSVRVEGVLIQGRFPLRIVRSCDAAEPLVLLVAAIVAFPSSWRRRLAGAGLGAALLFAVNAVRIASLYLIGVAHPGLFDLAHLDVWPVMLVVVAAVIFFAWASWSQRAAGADEPAPA
jgi:exosortase family protein XrtM